MKKILVFILALMMMIGTIGCSAEQKDNTAESTTAAAQTTASSESTASGEKNQNWYCTAR